jgi:hypothetical protein
MACCGGARWKFSDNQQGGFMSVRRWPWLAFVGLLACAGPLPRAAGEPFWRLLPVVRRVEAKPDKAYTLTEKQGPWLILAYTFAGDNAQERAAELVLELRRDFGMTAYTHRKHFDFDNDTTPRRLNRYGELQKIKYRVNELDEVAVLVGDFPSVDDDRARKMLEKIKYRCEPQCLKPSSKRVEDHPFVGFRGVWKTISMEGKGTKTVKKKSGPMCNALLTTNPLLPDEYFAPKGLDKFVIEMNKPVKHSLLECPGRYTVKVATFSGQVIIDQKKIQDIQRGKEVSSRLAEAADKAHRLTETLREQGYEAYEFHDRGQSIVCVGSFDSCGSPRADGKIEINPQIHKIMTTFQSSSSLPGQMGMPVKVIAGVPLDIQPMIVEVPKRSLSSDYAEVRLWR